MAGLVACLGDERAAALVRSTGWAADEGARTAARDAEPAALRAALERLAAEKPALLLATADFARKLPPDCGGVPVLALPGDEPRLSCTIYDPFPYGPWPPPRRGTTTTTRPAPQKEPSGAAAEDRGEEDEAAEDAARRRIEALVAALFRLAERCPGAWADSQLVVLGAAAQEMAHLLRTARRARAFARALNAQRTRLLDIGPLYPAVAGLLLNCLDRAQRARDVEAILNAMMLSQTFYRAAAPTPDARARRQYLKSALQAHPVWADLNFWRAALDFLVARQRGQTPDEHDAEAAEEEGAFFSWSSCIDLSAPAPAAPAPGAATRAAAGNLPLWSQVGGVVHAMLEFGIQPNLIASFVDSLDEEYPLQPDQRALVDDHIRAHRQVGTVGGAL